MNPRDELRERLDAMGTDELVEILEHRDRGEWREEVFPIVEEILRARGVEASTERSAPAMGAPEDSGAFTSVGTFSTAMQANLCKMALAESSIEAWLPTEHLAGVSPPLGLAFGVDVVVRDEDAPAARDLLRELDLGGAALAQVPEPCPRCGSVDTEHVDRPDRLGAVAGWVFVGTPLPAVKWEWVCRNCGHEWL